MIYASPAAAAPRYPMVFGQDLEAELETIPPEGAAYDVAAGLDPLTVHRLFLWRLDGSIYADVTGPAGRGLVRVTDPAVFPFAAPALVQAGWGLALAALMERWPAAQQAAPVAAAAFARDRDKMDAQDLKRALRMMAEGTSITSIADYLDSSWTAVSQKVDDVADDLSVVYYIALGAGVVAVFGVGLYVAGKIRQAWR